VASTSTCKGIVSGRAVEFVVMMLVSCCSNKYNNNAKSEVSRSFNEIGNAFHC